MPPNSLSLSERLKNYQAPATQTHKPVVEGRLIRVVGLTMEAVGFHAAIGCPCSVINDDGESLEAEVVGFSGDKLFLMPVKSIQGVRSGARVIPHKQDNQLVINEQLLGRVIDGLGQPIDDLGALDNTQTESSSSSAVQARINPLQRAPIVEALDVGIRAINALIPVGKGQRLGLFAGSGVGKSVLLGMMTRFTTADVVVVGLIGERGREVKEFIDHSLGEEGLKRSVVVASPADESPLMRLRASQLASQIAEHYRDQGKEVLLLMDSLTRYAQAQREIALAIGEPPATKGYPPSVFAKLPQLVERAGNGKVGSGSITAFYTVLTEGDDLQDPIADSARAILDGHVVLSRQLAESGIYPAIDVEMSISRVTNNIADKTHIQWLQRFRQLLATYYKNRDLINIGAYIKGADKEVDLALEYFPRLQKFIQQDISEAVSCETSLLELKAIMDNIYISSSTSNSSPNPASQV
jgi:flagellum-specific ATP synthase